MIKKYSLYILGLVGGMGVASSDVYISSLPYLISNYHVSPELLNFTITAYFLATAASSISFSHIHSYIPAKKCFVFAFLIFITSTFLISIYPSEWIILSCRISQGLAFGIIQPLIISHITTSGDSKNVGKNMSAFSFGAEVISTIAPISGGLLFTFLTWNSPFLFMGLVTMLLLYMSFGLIKDDEKIKFRESTLKSMKRILQDSDFIRFNFLGFFMIGLAWAIITISAYELNNPVLHGIVYSGFCGLYGLGCISHEKGYISEQKFIRFFPLLILGTGVCAVLGLCLNVKSLLAFSFLLFGLISGLFYGPSVARAFKNIPANDKSHASSLLTFSRLISSAISIQLSALLYFNVKSLFFLFIFLIFGVIATIAYGPSRNTIRSIHPQARP